MGKDINCIGKDIGGNNMDEKHIVWYVIKYVHHDRGG